MLQLTHLLRQRLLVLLCGVCSTTLAQAQTTAPDWESVLGVNGVHSTVVASATDASGNVYLVGPFTGTIRFGSTSLTCAENIHAPDVYVAKWSPATNSFLWAVRAGGGRYDNISDIAVSGNSVYITGSFESPVADFGGLTLSNFNSNTAETNYTPFVAKLTDAGTSASFTWAQRIGGQGSSVHQMEARGNTIYLAGGVGNATAIGPRTIDRTAGTLFVAKLTDVGSSASYVWAEQNGSGGSVVGFNDMVLSGANLYLAGSFQGLAVAFGNTTLSLNRAADGSFPPDVFVTKLTDAGSTGRFVWAKQAGGIDSDWCNALAVSGNSIYLSGAFYSSRAQFGTTSLDALGFSTLYVAKLTDAGADASFVWAQKAGGRDIEMGQALAVSGNSVFVAGSFTSPTLTVGSSTLTKTGSNPDIFVAKLIDSGSTGSFVWAQQAGGPAADVAYSLLLSGSKVQVTGSFSTPARFGNTTMQSFTNTQIGFLATLTDNTLLGAGNPALLAGLSVFPNPAQHRATVQLPAVPGATQATLTLLDALGRPVRAYTVALTTSGLRQELQLDGLAAGLYTLRIEAGSQQAARSLAIH